MLLFHRASAYDGCFPNLEFWRFKLAMIAPWVLLKPFVPGEI